MGLKDLRERFRHCELIIEVLDARNPEGTKIRKIEHWSGRERLIKVATKVDLADKITIDALKLNPELVLINAKAKNQQIERKKLINAILSKSTIRPLRVFVVGYPNVGKSTVINLLACGKKARTSPIAGTTKNIQWIRIHPEVLLYDTPGVFPSIEKRTSLIKKGAINLENLKNTDYYALRIGVEFLEVPDLKKWLTVYLDVDLSSVETPEALINKIAERRNLLKKKGELNTEEASKILIRAYLQSPKSR